MTDLNNPYSAPSADITPPEPQEPEPTRFFALNGRIGRCRFLVYSTVGTVAFGLACGIILALLEMVWHISSNTEPLDYAVGFLAFAPVILMGRRRLHDLDRSAWWSLLLLFFSIPSPFVAAFMMLFLVLPPGSKSANRFGPAPSPNPWWLTYIAVPLSLAAIGWGMVDIYGTLETQHTGQTSGAVH